MSWDKEIMGSLPEPLTAQFPAQLTHRSALSTQAFAIMRCCFQNGMGAKQFADSLNVLQRRKHERLEVQYLQTILQRHKLGVAKASYPPFPKFEVGATHAPSPGYCRDIYDNFIETYDRDFDQYSSQLSTRVLAIDRSHKVTKQIAKVEGEPVFNALLTITNEYGQIRICDLVLTKQQSQYSIALTKMLESSRQNGLEEPQVVFTDNMADKPMLKDHLPSLLKEIHPAGLDKPLLNLPENVVVEVCKSASRINDVVLGLIGSLANAEGATLTVGLDTE
jgi:hypothetical protein